MLRSDEKGDISGIGAIVSQGLASAWRRRFLLLLRRWRAVEIEQLGIRRIAGKLKGRGGSGIVTGVGVRIGCGLCRTGFVISQGEADWSAGGVGPSPF